MWKRHSTRYHGQALEVAIAVILNGRQPRGHLFVTRQGQPMRASGFRSIWQRAMAKTEGFQSPGSMLSMPPRGGNPMLTEEGEKAVLAYLRSQFGRSRSSSRETSTP